MTDVTRLSNSGLDRLPETIKIPRFDRSSLKPGIIHIGLGNFHRAHQAWYLQQLMQMGQAHDWAILGAGVRAYDASMREKLLAQDCLTTLIELDPDHTSAEIVGSMTDYLPIEEHHRALVRAMAEPQIRIVSLTVTEGGYFTNPESGGFDLDHPDVRHDVNNPENPQTVFGAIVSALKQRRETNAGPFTVQSCDNLQGNGRITANAVITLARLSDPGLAEWVENEVSFPNSMVDCIVPSTGPREIALARSIGIDDSVPVTHENFRQWVIEDNFCAGRPDWDKAGATFTDNVHDYEAMKIRILNAGHQVVANAGEILSLETISDCMANPTISNFFRKVELEEIARHVEPVSGMTPTSYVDLVERRFSNAAVHDTTRRVAFDGSSRHPGFLLPILRDALAAGAPIEGLSLVEALWARMCAGVREDGSTIEPNDPLWDDLVGAAMAAKDRPLAWLEQRHIYADLSGELRFSSTFSRWLSKIWTEGAEAAMNEYCQPASS